MLRSFMRKAQLTTKGGCLATGAPNQPGGLTATGGVGTISLSWTADSTAAPNQATYYEVERSNDGLGSWSVIATNLGTNSYTDTVAAGLTRHYRVYAYNCDSGSLASATANATSQSGALSPSWSLDFSSGTPSGYTLTRASSGTYVDSSGYISSQASGTSGNSAARLTHNSSGSRLGLLVEESRTNRAPKSELLDTWSFSQVTRTTVSAITAPDGTGQSASKLAGSSLQSYSSLYYSDANLASGDYSLSVYAKADGVDFLFLFMSDGTNDHGRYFDLANGSLGNTIGTLVSSSISAVGNGWYRCVIVWNNPSSATRYPGLLPSTTNATGRSAQAGTSPNGVLVWGAQFEAGSAPTAYIDNTGTGTVTRSADLAHVLDSSVTSWGDPGALVIHFYPPGKAGTLLSTDDASTAQVGIEASSTTAARAFWSSGSTSTGTIGSSGVQKAVHYWNGSTSKFCINGGTVQSGTNNLTIANTDFVTLGAEATDSSNVPGTFSQYANCVIRKVEFYSGTLTDANLQTVTT
jgi:hypothetical protein